MGRIKQKILGRRRAILLRGINWAGLVDVGGDAGYPIPDSLDHLMRYQVEKCKVSTNYTDD